MSVGSFLSGIFGTQSQVPVAAQGPLQLQDLSGLNQQTLDNYGQVNQGQNNLAQALIAQQQGNGPNPAAALLTNAQGQNAQQAAGVYANNRAINPALAARQASNLQAQAGTQSANQAAALTAQQQLNATSQLGGLYGQQGNQALSLYGTNQGAQANQNQAINNANQINAGVASGNQQGQNGLVGGLLNGLGSLGSSAISSGAKAAPAAAAAAYSGGKVEDGHIAHPGSFASFLAGGQVPGQAPMAGDSPKNDNVPAMLSPGEIVVPRTSASDPEKAKDFIDHIMKKQGTTGGYGQMMAKHRELSTRIAALEKKLGKKAA